MHSSVYTVYSGKNPFRAFRPVRWRGISPHVFGEGFSGDGVEDGRTGLVRAYGISIFFSREPKSGQVLDKYVVLLDLQTVWGGGASGRRVLPGTPISYHKELESCMECRVL